MEEYRSTSFSIELFEYCFLLISNELVVSFVYLVVFRRIILLVPLLIMWIEQFNNLVPHVDKLVFHDPLNEFRYTFIVFVDKKGLITF